MKFTKHAINQLKTRFGLDYNENIDRLLSLCNEVDKKFINECGSKYDPTCKYYCEKNIIFVVKDNKVLSVTKRHNEYKYIRSLSLKKGIRNELTA